MDRFEVGGIRALSDQAAEASEKLDEAARAANANKGYACALCADTGLRPAPAPYGLVGCTWPCFCSAGRQRDLAEVVEANARLEADANRLH